MPTPNKRRHGIQAQIIALALGVSLLVAVAVIINSVTALYRNTQRSNAQSVEYSLQVAASSLSQSIADIDSLADWSSLNSTLRSFVLGEYDVSDIRLTVYNVVSNKYSSLATARYIQRYLVTNGSNRVMQLGTVTNQSRALNSDTIPQLPAYDESKTAWQQIISDPLLSANALPAIPVTRTLYSGSRSARVYITVSISMITDAVRSYALTEDCTLYWIMGGQVYEISRRALTPLGTVEEAFRQSSTSIELLDQNSEVWELAEGSAPIIGCPLGKHGLYIAQSLPAPMLFAQLPSIAGSLVSSFFGILLLGLMLSVVLRHNVAKPIVALQEQLERISAGNFSPNRDIEWNNELGDIGRGINSLAHDVAALMDKRLEDEKQKQDLEYRMLQNQINPHFLYNTLNSIKWMATIQHAPGIAEMTTALSRLLKSVSKGNERLVSLQAEFALLNDYFTIQQYRYGGTVMLEVDYIEDERLCRDCMIPRFTLQPLVENAIFHGIEPKGCAGNVSLRVLREAVDGVPGDVLIELCDDGVGIQPEKLAHILEPPGSEDAAAKFRHVGLWNVHRRLQYSFGEGYGLTLRSTPGQGTTVTVRVPFAPAVQTLQKEVAAL